MPRPTLYRYLREYSIPHGRKSGKISIPEESVELLKEARELHEEGMSIDSVRRRLREGRLDLGTVMDRLDEISDTVAALAENDSNSLNKADGLSSPDLRDGTATDKDSLSLQTLVERQDSLISAVFTLTEISENLLSQVQQLGAQKPGGALEEAVKKEAEQTKQLSERIGVLETGLESTAKTIQSLSASMESLTEMTTYIVNVASLLKSTVTTTERHSLTG